MDFDTDGAPRFVVIEHALGWCFGSASEFHHAPNQGHSHTQMLNWQMFDGTSLAQACSWLDMIRPRARVVGMSLMSMQSQ